MSRRGSFTLVVASLASLAGVAACGFDASGTGANDLLAHDASGAYDSGVLDSSHADTGASADASIVDSTVQDGATPDASTADSLVAADAAPTFCDSADPTLIACYRFDGDGDDGSQYHNDLTVTGASWISGVVGQALSMAPGATVTAPDSASLGVTNALTIEMWVLLRTLPTTGRVGLVDDDGRFGLFVYAPGVLRATSPTPLESPSALPTNAWTHVAFTYDGATMTLYENGVAVVSTAIAGTFGTPSGSGLAVGMNSPSGDVLDGAIDSLRIYRVARASSLICKDAGAC